MVQSIERAFAVLDVVRGQPLGVTSIAERVGLPKSTVARLLSTLEGMSAIERVDGTRWRIGPRLASYAERLSPERSLALTARPILADLVAETGEAAGLALPDGYEMRYVAQVDADNAVQVRDWTGTKGALHAVPSGLVVLADWPAEAREAYIAHGLGALTPHTVTSAPVLRDRLRATLASGHAWGLEEFAQGINSVAAPVRDARGNTIAALHVHGPAYRFPMAGGEAEIAALVIDAAARLGAALPRQAA